MRLLTYETALGARVAVLRGERVVELALGYRRIGQPAPGSLDEFIAGGDEAWTVARRAVAALAPEDGVPLDGLRLAPPFIPRTIICGGANFADHLDETHREKPDHVEFFLKSPSGVIGAGTDVRMDRALSTKYDYEVELGIVIGRPARNVTREAALDHVCGYTIINDVTVRDQQVIPWDPGRYQLRFGEGKSYRDSAPLGPWLVTADELPDVSGLSLRTRVDGQLRQNNSMRNIIWDVPALISYYSTYMTLEPGFLIAAGTPGGPALGSDVELGADPYKRHDGVVRGSYVPDGALVECEIEGIGVLANRYVVPE